jgi:hypothetical protein
MKPLFITSILFVMIISVLSCKQTTENQAITQEEEQWSDLLNSEFVGNTVNIAEATYTNTIGDALLMGYWEDPDFEPSEKAFYYVRVLEIPTPRWTAHDAKFFGVEMPEGTVMQLQERAYTSPIWYNPN